MDYYNNNHHDHRREESEEMEQVILRIYEKAINEYECKGIALFVGPTSTPLDHPSFETLYSKAEENGVPIWLHPNRPQFIPDYNFYDRREVIGQGDNTKKEGKGEGGNMDEWMRECIDNWMHDKWVKECVDARMNGRKDGWMNTAADDDDDDDDEDEYDDDDDG